MLSYLLNWVRQGQVWKSVFRHGVPRDRRTRAMAVLSNVFLHLHPVAVRKSGIRLSFTWCMGGLTFFLFLVETITGVLLMFYYRPTLEWAFNDILALRDVTTLGIMREIPRWGAHAMVITVWLHIYRVFLTGSYKPPREFNWVVGVILLVLTLVLSFTGYLLPWDQLALWAVTVGHGIGGSAPFFGDETQLIVFGGFEVGPSTLIRFYTLHVIALPIIAAVFMSVHFWRIRRDGGMARPL